jgi:hypothetical protein
MRLSLRLRQDIGGALAFNSARRLRLEYPGPSKALLLATCLATHMPRCYKPETQQPRAHAALSTDSAYLDLDRRKRSAITHTRRCVRESQTLALLRAVHVALFSHSFPPVAALRVTQHTTRTSTAVALGEMHVCTRS